ncbi:MAG: nicotinate-nucleotide diphosphorylase, partial [Thiotrichales bacterium]|nr:nicotinate-nucleotide diphosphorylase [Thiotrichales bacterium]
MKNDIKKIVELALSEDIGEGDVSSVLIDNKIIEAEIICRDDAIICGVEFFNLC